MAIEILTDAHREFAAALLTGTPRAQIARDLGVSRNTLYEWMRDPLWRAYFQKLAADKAEAQSARMVITVMKAADVMDAYLEKILDAVENPQSAVAVPGIQLGSLPGVDTISQVFKRLAEMQRLDAGQPTEHRKVETTGTSPEAKVRGRKVKGALDKLLERDTDDEPGTTH